ncbi:MAG TPA: hypothetical protein VI564_05310 [Candidatus Nanoarchaeia archaeon]|nr:hypothetical protein [Candidatus Nanoarchaeia archaeon]
MSQDKSNEKTADSEDLPSPGILNNDEFVGMKELYERLKLSYGAVEILDALENNQVFIPVSIFNHELSSLELVTKYLHENKGIGLKKIAGLLGRSSANIWNSYKRSQKKFPQKLTAKDSVLIPLNSITNKKLSLLENIVSYLKDSLKLSYHEIAVMLKRDDRTVWTVYSKVRRKNAD